MPFSPERRREYDAARTTASRKRNDARAAKRADNRLHFVAVDGEGVTRPDGTHEYTLLSMGDQSLYHPDGSRLTTLEIFQWLWDNQVKGACHVGFFLGYDFAQWLRDLPEERARMLFTDGGQAARRRTGSGGNPTPFPVDYKRWEFDVLPPMRRFKLRPRGWKVPWLVICDSGPMFQTSLLKAIDPADWPQPICSPEEFATVKAGKADRGREVTPHGTPVDPQTIRYNLLENEILSRLLTRYNAGLMSMEVKLRRDQWYGPGQAAQGWLKNVASEHLTATILETAERRGMEPDYREAFDAARGAYFGGWFEIMAHGPIPGTTWEYDINSAYPAIISTLPCLLHGRWIHYTVSHPRYLYPAKWQLVRAHVKGSDPFIGTMLHRTPKGRVLRPYETLGWYWRHELEAARLAGLIDTIEVEESWVYEPCRCPPPFAGIRELYQHRLEHGKKSPEGKAMKLVYNSSYGKFTQSVGLPKFGNPVYASLITAGCRTMILDAIATHPKRSAAVVMVATDGVYFTSPHPTLDVNPERLGAWDVSEKLNMCLFKPGVYWDDASRASLLSGGRLKLKSRGVNERALAKWIPQIDRDWKGFVLGPTPLTWPSAKLEVPFALVGPKQALNRRKWDLCGAVEPEKKVGFSSWPGDKRVCLPPATLPDGLIRTAPYPQHRDGIESTPYDKGFGLDLQERTELNEVMTPDGPADMVLMREGLGL